MSAQELGKKTGTATSTVIRFANGGQPSLATLHALAAEFGHQNELNNVLSKVRTDTNQAIRKAADAVK